MFLTALLAAALSAPVPKEKPAPLFYPVTVGATRVLGGVEDGAGETAEEVTEVEEKDGVYTVTVQASGLSKGAPVWTKTRVYEVSAGKVVRRVGEEREAVFDLGAKAGTWNVEVKAKGKADVTASFAVGKEEEVDTPAGKFKAVPVTERWPHPEREIANTRWYAPGIGVVKQFAHDPESTALLKSFTPGKDAKK
jgi:hypothetical protein